MWPIQHPCLRAQVSTPIDTHLFIQRWGVVVKRNLDISCDNSPVRSKVDVVPVMEASQTARFVIGWPRFCMG